MIENKLRRRWVKRLVGTVVRRSVAACLTVGFTFVAGTPALALSQRGHSFAGTFASRGEGAGRLQRPEGVAVSEASGDVYVVDSGNNRIDRFGNQGEFIEAWGWGVSDGKPEFEVCSASCRAGIAGEGEGELDAPQAIAIDNSTNPADPSRGDVYVLADTVGLNDVVEKFSASGKLLGRLHFESEAPGSLGGVAADASGTVSVSDLSTSEIVRFDDADDNEIMRSLRLEVECAETLGFAADPTSQAFYVSHQLASLEGECPEAAASAKAPALVAKVGEAGELQSEALEYEDTSGIAVDLESGAGSALGEAAKGDVYLDNGTSIAEFDATGSFIARFGSAEQLAQGAGVAINSQTGDVYVADAKGDRIAVFAPEAAQAPSVDAGSFRDLSPTSTELKAQIDPHGNDTHYYFQYCLAASNSCLDAPAPPGEDIGSGFDSETERVVVEGLQPATSYAYRVIAANAQGQGESAGALQTFTTLSNAAHGLIDDRAWELVSPAEKFGALIYPIGGNSQGAAPASGLIEASANGSAITYSANAALGEEAPGNRSPEATQVISARGPEGWSTKDIVTPHEKAEGIKPTLVAQEYRSFSPDLASALVQPFGMFGNRFQEPSLVPGTENEERGLYIRDEAGCQTAINSCYQPLVSSADDTSGAQYGGQLDFDGASANLQHVIFSSSVSLISGALSATGLYEWNAGKPVAEALELISVLPGNAEAAPEESDPQLGDFNPEISSERNAVSQDGSRVFWSAALEEKTSTVTDLYMRDTTMGTTVRLNAAQGIKEPPPGEREHEEVHFRTASADGSRAFFTDTFPLTSESRLRRSEEGPADLYVCEALEGPGCRLTDLTVDPGFDVGEAAEVVGAPLGASEDGSYIYFVANGVLDSQALADGATRGDCAASPKAEALAGASCNLYLEHYNAQSKAWEAPRFIARLSQEDQPDWGTGNGALARLTARVSPNGSYLAFMSKEPLTGYNNVDQSPQANGARDEEVYLYDAADGRLVCASCNPSGSRPNGVLDREDTSEGKGLLVDRFAIWQESAREERGEGSRSALDHWLAGSIPGWTPLSAYTALYQSRYLSNEGRLFFDSPDALVPHDTNDKEDVYEYEPEGLGNCQAPPGCVALISSGESDHESAFLDAGENGDDVFFLTNQPLSATDHDTSYDVYDARVCSASSPCLSPPQASSQPCESLQSCRAISPSQQSFPGPSGTASVSAPGNATPQVSAAPRQNAKPKPLTRAQRLARALNACRRLRTHSKRKRQGCERRARKQFAAKTSRALAKRRKQKR